MGLRVAPLMVSDWDKGRFSRLAIALRIQIHSSPDNQLLLQPIHPTIKLTTIAKKGNRRGNDDNDDWKH